MMTTVDVGYVSALLAGFLSFFSPCVLPLIPIWLCYMAGVSIQSFRMGSFSLESGSPRKGLLLGALVFILGFSSVFVTLGLTTSMLGHFLRSWRDPLIIFSGFLVLVMGLNFLEILRIPFLFRTLSFKTPIQPTTLIGGYAMGIAFALGWTPCIGPILGVVLTLSASRDTFQEGAFLLSLYSIGFAFPLLFFAFFSSFFIKFFEYFRSYISFLEKIVGIFLVIFGIFFIIDYLPLDFYRFFIPPEIFVFE